MHSLMIDVTVYIVKKTNLKRKCQNNFARTKQVLIGGVMDKKRKNEDYSFDCKNKTDDE